MIYYFFQNSKNAVMAAHYAQAKHDIGNVVDLGMYDSYNPKAFGTTNEADRRVTNYGVRREFNVDPLPLGEGCTDCPKYGVPDPKAVMKIDDTVKGIEEGLNADVYTIGVLTGTQSIQRLDSAGPNSILRSVAELPGYLTGKGLV